MATKTEEKQADVLNPATEAYFDAMKTGLKIQEDCVVRMAKLFQGSIGADNWAERMQNTAKQAIPQMKTNTEEVLKIVEQGTRQGMDVLGKAIEVAQCKSVSDGQYKVQQLWEASLATLNNSAQAIIQTNMRLMRDWADFIKRSMPTA